MYTDAVLGTIWGLTITKYNRVNTNKLPNFTQITYNISVQRFKSCDLQHHEAPSPPISVWPGRGDRKTPVRNGFVPPSTIKEKQGQKKWLKGAVSARGLQIVQKPRSRLKFLVPEKAHEMSPTLGANNRME